MNKAQGRPLLRTGLVGLGMTIVIGLLALGIYHLEGEVSGVTGILTTLVGSGTMISAAFLALSFSENKGSS